jgi:TonB family protein
MTQTNYDRVGAGRFSVSFLCFALGTTAFGIGRNAEAGDIPAVKTPVRIDTAHPPVVQGSQYPPESALRREQGICAIRMQVDSDGLVRAKQLVASTGYARLDAACLASFVNARFIPATLNGEPVANWINMPLVWKLSPGGGPWNAPTDDQIRVPIVEKEYGLKIGPNFYPAGSRAMHQEGDCTVHAFVKEDGKASNIGVIKSTGFATLDQACIAVIQQAPFVPAHANGIAIGAFADINIRWGLPRP